MKIKTVNLQGDETTVDLGRKFAYVECNNLSESEILLSESTNFERGDDGVIIINAGSTATIGDLGTPQIQTIYLKGSGEVQIVGKGYALSSFKIARKGGGDGKLLTLVKNGDTVNGLTGFDYLNNPNGCGISKKLGTDVGNIKVNEPFYCMMYKAYSYNSNNPDSFIISTNEKIDLTNYNYIMFNFLSTTDYGVSDYNNFGGGYFCIDRPENLPVNNVPYNWDGWDAVFTRNQVIDLFIKDISNIKGQHYLCFGLCHGNYNSGYTSYFSFNNLLLI